MPTTQPESSLVEERTLQLIGQILVDHAPADWKAIMFSARCTTSVSSYDLQITDRASTTSRHDVPSAVGGEVNALRRMMYRPDTGTWLSMRINILSTGDYGSAFDYDSPPLIDRYIPEWSDITYALDLLEYPRSEPNIPEWLRDKVDNSRLQSDDRIGAESNSPLPPKGNR